MVKAHWLEMKIFEQAREALRGSIQIQIVPGARDKADAMETGLCRIQFPRVQVENEALPFLLVDSLQGHLGEGIGEETEVTAAGHRNIESAEVGGGERKFHEAAALQSVGKARCVRDAITVMADGENARVVGEVQFFQDVEGP